MHSSLFQPAQHRDLTQVLCLDRYIHAEVKYLVSAIPLLIAVTGRVWASKPATCELSDNKGAIVVLREDKKSQTRTDNIWFTDNEPLRQVVKESPWALVDGMGPFQTQLPVIDGRHATPVDCYDVSGDVFLPVEEGLVDQVLGQLVGHKNLGFRRTEHYLPIGTEVTVVGELTTASSPSTSTTKGTIRDDNGRILVLKQPRHGPFILSKHSLSDLLASAQHTSWWCSRVAGVMTSAGVAMLAASWYLKYLKAKREKEWEARVRDIRRRGNTTTGATGGATTTSSNQGQGENNDGARTGMCVVCWDRPSDMVFPECGHLCVCRVCVQEGAGSGAASASVRCPICRTGGRPIRVFQA